MLRLFQPCACEVSLLPSTLGGKGCNRQHLGGGGVHMMYEESRVAVSSTTNSAVSVPSTEAWCCWRRCYTTTLLSLTHTTYTGPP